MFKKIKKIRTKILIPTLIVLFLALLTTGALSSFLSYRSTIETLDLTMTENVTIASERIGAELQVYKTLMTELAGSVQTIAPEQVLDVVESTRKRHGFAELQITLPNGSVGTTQQDVSQMPFFTVPRDQGIAYVSDPVMNADNQSMTVYISAPILVGERFDGIIYVAMDAKALTDIVTDISVGESGDATIVNKHGTTIAYKDYHTVLSGYNTNAEAVADPSLAHLAEIETAVMAGGSGFEEYVNGKVKNFVAYAPIEGTDGWGMYITVTQAEFMQATRNGLVVTIAATVIFLIIAVAVLQRIAGSISKGVVAVERAAVEMAKGNYDVTLTYQAQDETGVLANSMRQMMQTTKAIILDTERGLSEVASGNFNICPRVEYIGVFVGIENALKRIIVELSETMAQIKIATEQVASGSEQVSDGAQELAQGATEQASSIEELSAAISEVSHQISNNASNAARTNELAMSAGTGLTESNSRMAEMIAAMSEISSSSTQISKIIKTIEDIAFQTNILALNAAVEAARAGAAGKGFAVVADEVRNLATKSSEAAKQTNLLIEGSVKSVGNGVKIADETAKSLEQVVAGSLAMAELIGKISAASAEQSLSISQINLGIEQISAVVQTNSATSEQSAAASEELNGQAETMKILVDKFRLLQMSKEQMTGSIEL